MPFGLQYILDFYVDQRCAVPAFQHNDAWARLTLIVVPSTTFMAVALFALGAVRRSLFLLTLSAVILNTDYWLNVVLRLGGANSAFGRAIVPGCGDEHGVGTSPPLTAQHAMHFVTFFALYAVYYHRVRHVTLAALSVAYLHTIAFALFNFNLNSPVQILSANVIGTLTAVVLHVLLVFVLAPLFIVPLSRTSLAKRFGYDDEQWLVDGAGN